MRSEQDRLMNCMAQMQKAMLQIQLDIYKQSEITHDPAILDSARNALLHASDTLGKLAEERLRYRDMD